MVQSSVVSTLVVSNSPFLFGESGWPSFVGDPESYMNTSVALQALQLDETKQLRREFKYAAASHEKQLARQSELLEGAIAGWQSVGEGLEMLATKVNALADDVVAGFTTLERIGNRQTELLEDVVRRLDRIELAVTRPHQTEAKEFFDLGQQRLREGLYPEAHKRLLASEAIIPENPVLQTLLGKLHYWSRINGVEFSLSEAERRFDLALRYLTTFRGDPGWQSICDFVYRSAAHLQYVRAGDPSLSSSDGRAERERRLARARSWLSKPEVQSGTARLLLAQVVLQQGDHRAAVAVIRELVDESRMWITRALAEPNLAAIADDVSNLNRELDENPGPHSTLAFGAIRAVDRLAGLVKDAEAIVGLHDAHTLESQSTKLEDKYHAGVFSSEEVPRRARELVEKHGRSLDAELSKAIERTKLEELSPAESHAAETRRRLQNLEHPSAEDLDRGLARTVAFGCAGMLVGPVLAGLLYQSFDPRLNGTGFGTAMLLGMFLPWIAVIFVHQRRLVLRWIDRHAQIPLVRAELRLNEKPVFKAREVLAHLGQVQAQLVQTYRDFFQNIH